jgi:chaperonin GroEL (HSP60 family)
VLPTPPPPKKVGAERYNLFTGCPQARTATIVLRGGSEQFIDEADRSLHDAIMIVRWGAGRGWGGGWGGGGGGAMRAARARDCALQPSKLSASA